MLEQRLGDISDFHQLTEGLSSQAFGFCYDDEKYVIRTNRAIDGFKKDAYVSRKFVSTFLPIPEVLDIDYMADGHAFCISRRAPGVRLHDLDEEGLRRMASPTIGIMRAIAGADLLGTTGFGYFDSRGVAPFSSSNNFLISICLVETLSEYCPEERSLIHGDFGSYNVLSDGGTITAVIDWELALFGGSLYEMANLLFWSEERLMPVIQELRSLSELSHFEERIICCQLRIGLREIYVAAAGAAPPRDLIWLATRCTEIMESAKKH